MTRPVKARSIHARQIVAKRATPQRRATVNRAATGTRLLLALLAELLSLPAETRWVAWKHNYDDPDMFAERISIMANSAAPIITTGKRRRPYVFHIVLSHSRKAYSEVSLRQTTGVFFTAWKTPYGI